MSAHQLTRSLLINSFILATVCLIIWAQAAPATTKAPPASGNVPTSTLAPTKPESIHHADAVSQSEPTSASSSPSTNAPLAEGAESTATTAAPSAATTTTLSPTTTGDDQDTLTSTTDSIGVHPDEPSSEPEPSSSIDSETDDLPGIEAKSISKHSEENNFGKEAEESSAKLSIEKSNPNEEDGEDGNEKEQPDVGSKMKARRLKSSQPVNMTLVDQIYLEGHKDEQETVENWNKMRRQLKKGISGLIGSIVPFALNMSQEAKISSECTGAMLKWILNMNQLKAWALRMLDASGKPIAGLLEGSMTMFGNYRQCLKVRAPDDDEIEFAGEFREHFRGKYCIVQAKPWLPEKSRFYNLNARLNSLATSMEEEENPWYDRTIFEELSEWLLAFNFVNIRFDICVPSLCKREDLQKAINFLMSGVDLKARILRCEMEPPNGTFGMAAQVESGSSEIADALQASNQNVNVQFKLENYSQIGWLVIPLMVALFVLIATALSMTTMGSTGHQHQEKKTTKIKHTIKSFSLKRSVSSHLNVDYDQLSDDKPLSLYGIRFILVMWVILVESAVNLKFEYLRELMMLKDLIFWWPMQFIINSTMQYDSFILLTAFTMGYKNCLNDGVNNARAISRFVLDKYIRLMPSIMIMVALVILMPLVYRGPVWNDYMTKQSAVCQSTGWINSVFLQNYLAFDKICLPQTWLLCVEFQLILLMAPIVYYLNKIYTTNYGGRAKELSFANGTSIKRSDLLTISTSRREDSSKAFHWFWTSPGAILMACILIGLGTSFYNVYYKELPPSWFYTMADPDSKALYFGEHMTKIWTHLAVFAIGLLAGIECRRASRNIAQSYRSSNISLMSDCVGAFAGKHQYVDHHCSSAASSVVPAKFTEKYSVVQAKSGESAKLECNATGDQPLTINWFKEENKLSKRGGENFEIYETMNNGGLNSVLVIRTVNRADGLTYKCIGENEFGNDERLIKLMVVEVPSRPLNVRVKDAWSRSASLVWSTPFAGNSPIISYIIQYWRKNNNEAGQNAQNHRRQEFTVSGTQSSALITNLMPSLTYEASVIAENQVGRSEPSENVVINTGEDEPTAAPSDVNVEARGPSTIRVAWKVPPSETWNGKLLGFYVGFRPRSAPNDVHQLNGLAQAPFSFRTIDYVKGQQMFETFLTNLARGHEYEVVVKAFNGVGSGPESHSMNVRTFDGDLPAPPNLYAHQTSQSSIALRWTYPSRAQSAVATIKRYVLYYQRQGDDSWLEIAIPVEDKLRSHLGSQENVQSGFSIGDSGTTNYVLNGLDSGFAYKIYVVAVNNFGMGDPSNIVTTKTEAVSGLGEGIRAGSLSNELNVLEMNRQAQLFLVVPITCTIIVVVVIVMAVLYCGRRMPNSGAQHAVSNNQQPQQQQSSSQAGTWGPEGPIQVGQRYVEFDKGGILKTNGSLLSGTQNSDQISSGHQGYPLPYGTMPMNSVVITDQKSWDRQSNVPLKPLVTHIYDSPINN